MITVTFPCLLWIQFDTDGCFTFKSKTVISITVSLFYKSWHAVQLASLAFQRQPKKDSWHFLTGKHHFLPTYTISCGSWKLLSANLLYRLLLEMLREWMPTFKHRTQTYTFSTWWVLWGKGDLNMELLQAQTNSSYHVGIWNSFLFSFF